MNEKLRNILYTISAILLVFAVVGLFIAHIHWASWIMLIGGIGYTFAHLLLLRHSQQMPTRRKRLLRMAIIAGFLWITASVFHIIHAEYWATLIIVAVIFMAYSNITQAFIKDSENSKMSQ